MPSQTESLSASQSAGDHAESALLSLWSRRTPAYFLGGFGSGFGCGFGCGIGGRGLFGGGVGGGPYGPGLGLGFGGILLLQSRKYFGDFFDVECGRVVMVGCSLS